MMLTDPFPVAVSWPPEIEPPLTTIAIPTFKRLHLLKEAVESALAQKDCSPFEVIVVDNGSGEEVRAWMAQRRSTEPRLGYFLNESNLGMVGNWNQCILLARGRFVSILHDDDLLRASFLSGFEGHYKGDDLVYACGVVTGLNVPHSWPPDGRTRRIKPGHLLLRNLTPFPGVVFPRGAAVELDGFDLSMYPSADYDFWVRIAGHVPTVRGQTAAAFYRVSVEQASSTIADKLVAGALPVRLKALASTRIPRWLGMPFVVYAQNQLRRVYSAPAEYRRASQQQLILHIFVSVLWRVFVRLSSK